MFQQLTKQITTASLRTQGPLLRQSTPLLRRFYHEKVLDHYNRPRNVGSLPKNDIDVGTGLVGAPACGDVMKLQIRVDETGRISDVKFKTFGCGSAIASSSFMTERVKGLTLEEAAAIRNTEVAKELSLPPVKSTFVAGSLLMVVHCSMLAEDAVKSAIRDYQSKRSKRPTLGPEATATAVATASVGAGSPVDAGAT